MQSSKISARMDAPAAARSRHSSRKLTAGLYSNSRWRTGLEQPIGASGWRPGWSKLLGGDAVADRYLIEPAAARFTWWPVETGDVRFDIEDRCAVDEVHPGEPYGEPGHVEDLDETVPEGPLARSRTCPSGSGEDSACIISG